MHLCQPEQNFLFLPFPFPLLFFFFSLSIAGIRFFMTTKRIVYPIRMSNLGTLTEV